MREYILVIKMQEVYNSILKVPLAQMIANPSSLILLIQSKNYDL